jgi:hypothetical protein
VGYHISVYSKATDESRSLELYQNPLGNGTQLWQYWLRPAGELGLAFLCEHFDDGMDVSGNDLDNLASDLDRLERHWVEAHVGASEYVRYSTTHPGGSREEGDIPMHDHLRVRLGFLREAIRIARESGGVLHIA